MHCMSIYKHVSNGAVMSEAPSTVAVGGGDVEEEGREYGCLAEELADARLLSKQEAVSVIESLTVSFLQAISRREDPELFLVSHPYIPVHSSQLRRLQLVGNLSYYTIRQNAYLIAPLFHPYFWNF